MSEKSLFDLHEKLTGENLNIEIKKKAVKRRSIKEVEEEKDDIIRELKKEIILLKNLLRFYIHDDW
jgi:hypothetical protein